MQGFQMEQASQAIHQSTPIVLLKFMLTPLEIILIFVAIGVFVLVFFWASYKSSKYDSDENIDDDDYNSDDRY